MRMPVGLMAEVERRLDLAERLEWRYGDPLARMRSAGWVADLTAWRRLCRLPERRR